MSLYLAVAAVEFLSLHLWRQSCTQLAMRFSNYWYSRDKEESNCRIRVGCSSPLPSSALQIMTTPHFSSRCTRYTLWRQRCTRVQCTSNVKQSDDIKRWHSTKYLPSEKVPSPHKNKTKKKQLSINSLHSIQCR